MRRQLEQVFKWIYVVLFALLALTDNNTIGYAICLVTIFAFFVNALSIEMAFMVSLVLGNEITCVIHLAICIVYLLMKRRFHFGKVNRKISICAGVLLISSLINMFISGAVYNTIFGIMYYIVALLLAKMFSGTFEERKVIESAKFLLQVETVAGILIILSTGSVHPGDVHKGTFPNAHYFTFWLICIITYIYVYYKNRGYSFSRNIKKNLHLYIFGTILTIMSSGKNVLAGFVLAAVVYGMTYIFSKKTKNRIMMSIVVMYIGIFIILLVLHLDIVKNLVRSRFPNVGLYIYDSAYAYKFKYFEGTIFEELKGLRSLFGYGIGQYGSRFANLFGYKYMYRVDNTINNFIANHFDSYILPNYAKYASLYSDELVAGIRWRSAVLTYPFSSIIAFLAENGVIGLGFMTYIWGKWANRSKYGILVVFLFASCIFDIYFDHISILVLILILVASGNINGKKRMNIENMIETVK